MFISSNTTQSFYYFFHLLLSENKYVVVNHTITLSDDGVVHSFGQNLFDIGQLGLRHYYDVFLPTPIRDLPKILQISCGEYFTVCVDYEGLLWSFGCNNFGQLGSISCVGYSCYLIDFEGNLWSFGNNKCGQLGHDNRIHNNVPTKIECLKEIQQMSYGSCGNHFLIKDSQNTIFVIGSNSNEQLGIEKSQLNIYKPKEISSQYFTIWGESINVNNRTKSARK